MRRPRQLRPWEWTPATRRIWAALLAGKEVFIRDPHSAVVDGVVLGNQIAAQRLAFAGLCEWVPGKDWTMRKRGMTQQQRGEDG